ncbi:Uncharacterized protein TCM_018989 [Theobroma cacao]|uniref:DUF7745 domain-containing protein n=1 Tax=Theobroma cacao TaxID=3641 RepID=A0A061EFL3_THECC|nr:Uncharacterized protein TCM_018989 [Theobroma cacao]
MGEDRGALLVRVDDSEERFGNLSSVYKPRSAYRVTRSINPAPSILAETFRSLNFCRRKGEGRFIGCAQLLTIWIKSHFECKESKFRKLYLSASCPILEFCESEWPDYKRKEEWVVRLQRLMSIEVTWRAPWMPRMQVMYKCGDKPWVPLMGPWGAISYAPIMDWKKTCRVDQGRVTDEVTTGYHTWHDQRVKNVIHPPNDPSKHPVNPEPQDVLLESELTRKKLEKEMMNMKRRHEDELEEVKKETTRKHEVQRKGQTIQELKNDCDMLETAMEGYKAQYEAVRQEYFQIRERNNSCTQSLQRKETEMQWILRQMREVAFRARVMADKTEELRREILPKDELSERLISHLKMVRDQYDKNKIPEKQILHRYNTRARSKIMGDEHSERMDKIEKKQEEIMGQLSKILELISTDKGKKAAGSSGTPEDVQQTETNTDPVYPPGFTPPPARNASIPMPSVGQYPFFGMPMGPPPTYAQQRPIGGASPSDPISVPDLDDPKEQEKLKYGSVESKDNPDTHQKFDLFEERLRMVEGMGMYCSMDAIELCLVPDVVIPPKFKVPDFEKYDGTKCPLQPHNKQHLQTTILPVNQEDGETSKRKCSLTQSQSLMLNSSLKSAVNMISKESTHPMKIKPLTIFYEPKGEFVEDKNRAKMIIEVPKPFPYKDNKAVPWNYNCNVQVSEAKKWIAESQDDAANITAVGGITRSGRCYSPEAFENLKNEKGEEKEQSPRREEFIKHSEYNVVEQLNRLPARISLLSLLLSSEPHRNSLMKILNQAYVDHDISVENLDYIVGNILVGNIISFSDEEIPSGGRGNYKALHITTKCKGCTVAKVLLDNGSSLNVMPMRTLARLPINMSYMRKSQMIVRAFDGTRREVVGDIEIPVEIGPCTFTIEFQVMDIAPSYNYFLGRPWIHMAGAIPSSLHQKVKFIVEGKIVCVNGEEDLLISKPADTPYVEATEEVPECSFRSFKFVNTTVSHLAWTAHRLRQYMLYHTTWLIAKLDPIKYIFEKPSLSGRVARWQVLLSEYDIVYVSQKAIKGSAIADFLAERVEEDYEPMEFEFPDEDLMSIRQTSGEESEKENWKMFFDGASNALGHGIGVVLVSPEGDHYPVIAKLNFYCTNNVAEYLCHGHSSSNREENSHFGSVWGLCFGYLSVARRMGDT